MIFEHTANTPAEAWRWVLKTVFADSVVKLKDVGIIGDCKTLDGIIVTEIKNPTDYIEKNPLYGKAFIDEYKKQFLSADSRGFEYTYGQRLLVYFDVNQINYIIRELKRDKNSRRAQGITWSPIVDTKNEDVPCLQLVRCTIVKGRLNMEVVFRSHDMLKGYYPNVLGLSYLMDYILAELGGYSKGYLRVVSMSPHVYLSDRDVFKAITGCKL